MPRAAREWPTRALWVLEDTKALAQEIDGLAREAQVALKAGNSLEAVIVLSDVRSRATVIFDKLTKARAGQYE